MRKIIIITLYGISALLIFLSVLKIFNENRIGELEYILTNENINEDIKSVFGDLDEDENGVGFLAIYFVESSICPPCLTEISEFYKTINNDYDLHFQSQKLIINTELYESAFLIKQFLSMEIDYMYDLDHATVQFLSNYGSQELVGQLIIINRKQRSVVARVILETAMPTDIGAKRLFLSNIID